MSEQELIKQAKLGNKEALEKLWDILTPKLFGFLVNTLKDKQVAEDVFQNTWLKAINALSSFNPAKGKFGSWIFVIAKNECRQIWRKDKHIEILDDSVTEPSRDDRKNSDNTILVDQIINKLSYEDQELLRLRYIADLPLNEIAAILNINFVAVRVRMHRAIKRAKTLVNEDFSK